MATQCAQIMDRVGGVEALVLRSQDLSEQDV